MRCIHVMKFEKVPLESTAAIEFLGDLGNGSDYPVGRVSVCDVCWCIVGLCG